ncbi:small ribosomal subunit protein uS15m [Phlebotomus argentipes]|uniref:small ribosomal subunit protein uS15m n=1 Tax=Phlebotomus argentipes TaxID=94469 RepID=UPI00289350BA|nr:small ribosomal subunit protein uS15m [Phlebotomus argentipes]
MSLFRKIVPFPGLRNHQVRFFKPELPIKWVRPERICCTHPGKSGDLSGSARVDLTLPVQEYRNSKLLAEADDIVRELFTLGRYPGKKTGHYLRNQMKAEVQRHAQDEGSMETFIADQTARIRRLQEIFAVHPRNRMLKVYLKELIEKRKKNLNDMRRWDYRRFEWILEKLDLVYKPYAAEHVILGRKYAVRKLTDTHCEELIQKKLLDYQKHLESQQVDFLKRKIKNLEFIRREQEDLKLPQTVTEEQINAAKAKLAETIKRQAIVAPKSH